MGHMGGWLGLPGCRLTALRAGSSLGLRIHPLMYVVIINIGPRKLQPPGTSHMGGSLSLLQLEGRGEASPPERQNSRYPLLRVLYGPRQIPQLQKVLA